MQLNVPRSCRMLCSRRTPADILGVRDSSGKTEIKMRFYELAKLSHPDVVVGARSEPLTKQEVADAHAAFCEIQEAFETLMANAAGASSSTSASASSPSSRAAHGSRRAARQGPVAQPGRQRERTLGELLSSRLEYDPSAVRDVWEDIKERRCDVTATMTSDLFKACGAEAAAEAGGVLGGRGGGMPLALHILREATSLGLLSHAVRTASLVSLLHWCQEHNLDTTFEVIDEIREEDRTLEVLAALNATFSKYPSGASF